MMMMREKLNFQRHTIFVVVVGRLSAVKIFRATRERPGARERGKLSSSENFCATYENGVCTVSHHRSSSIDWLSISVAIFLYSFSFVVTVRNLVKRVCRCIVCMLIFFFRLYVHCTFPIWATAHTSIVRSIWCFYRCMLSSSKPIISAEKLYPQSAISAH